jgi:Mce-associated membrane protein
MTTQLEDTETDDTETDGPDDTDGTEAVDTETDDTDVEPPEDVEPPRFAMFRGPRRIAVLLGVVAVLLAGAGTWALVAADGLRSSAAARNTALVDTGATAEVSAAVSSALNQVFSYSYDKVEVTEQAAATVLRGDALVTYNKLIAQVRAQAPSQKLVLTSRVVSSAVQSIEGDRARLLVFLDQSATRADTDTTSAAAAQLSITAKREGGHWVITDLAPR